MTYMFDNKQYVAIASGQNISPSHCPTSPDLGSERLSAERHPIEHEYHGAALHRTA